MLSSRSLGGILLGALIIVLCTSFLCSGEEPVRVLLFGDSTYETVYMPLEGKLHSVLQEKLRDKGHPCIVQNAARSGLCTQWAFDKGYWQNEVLGSKKSDIVIINFGANDQKRVDIKTYEANLRRMIKEAREAGIRVVLATCLWVDYEGKHYSYDRNTMEYLGKYSEKTLELAKEYGLTLVDMRKRFKDEIEGGNWDLFGHNNKSYYPGWHNDSKPPSVEYYSNIHPWAAGIEVMADEMVKTIEAYEPLFRGDPSKPGRSDGWSPLR